MSFIGSPLYYYICAAALAILVLLLIGCQVKTKRSPRKAPPPPPRPEQATQRPRYAAGDDMDRINRNAYTVDFEKKHSDAPAIIGSAIIGLLILLTVPQIINTVKQEMNNTSNTVTASAPAPIQPIPIGTVELHMISAEFNSDLTKLPLTLLLNLPVSRFRQHSGQPRQQAAALPPDYLRRRRRSLGPHRFAVPPSTDSAADGNHVRKQLIAVIKVAVPLSERENGRIQLQLVATVPILNGHEPGHAEAKQRQKHPAETVVVQLQIINLLLLQHLTKEKLG